MGSRGTLLWSLSHPFFSKSQTQDLPPISDLLFQVNSWTLIKCFEDKSTTSMYHNATIILISGACTYLLDIWAVQNVCLLFSSATWEKNLHHLSCICLTSTTMWNEPCFHKNVWLFSNKRIDVSLGNTSLLAKTQVITFRDMYFF